MHELADVLTRWYEAGESIAIATIVGVEGSAPRGAGARFCVTASGQMAGSVSAGCVESDVIAHASEVLSDGRSRIVSYAVADGDGLFVGLMCGGSIRVFIEPFRMTAVDQLVLQGICRRETVERVTVLNPDDLAGASVARRLSDGDALWVHATGSGGVSEKHSPDDPEFSRALREVLESEAYEADAPNRAVLFSYEGSSIEVFVERIEPRERLYIIGATHIAAALAPIALGTQFEVFVVDGRPAYLSDERFPSGVSLVDQNPADFLAGEKLDARCSVVSLIHDLKVEVPVLATALNSEARYVGALGSRRTAAKRAVRLAEEGFGDDAIERVHSPIGLNIGAKTPEEIAVSIVAELVSTRYASLMADANDNCESQPRVTAARPRFAHVASS